MRVAIRKQADANTVEVARRVLAEVESVNQAFPQIHIVPVINMVDDDSLEAGARETAERLLASTPDGVASRR